MNSSIKFKKSESFYIRDGWIEKALNAINDNSNINIFSKNNGIKILGIGSNMVKGLKYWLLSASLIQSNGKNIELTKLGKLIVKYDKYLEEDFSWFIIHYNLCTNMNECPIFYGVFNSNINSFTKNEALEMIIDDFSSTNIIFKREYVEEDLNVFLKSYINDNLVDNPEDNYVCPLSNLNLLLKKQNIYKKNRPIYNNLSYLIVYYALLNVYDQESFLIEEECETINSPSKIFNLDKNVLIKYLEEMKKNNLITINKTAGLNSIYFEKKLSIDEIFKEYYGW